MQVPTQTEQTVKKQTERKAATKTDKANSSSAAKSGTFDYLAELQKKNPKLNLLTGYSNGTPGSSNYPEKINVTIAPGFLEKMASDPKLAAEYEKIWQIYGQPANGENL